MAINGSQVAYTWARAGLARSGATRSHYVRPQTTVEWIARYADGVIKSRTNLGDYIRQGSLTVAQALNDAVDTCSFQLIPQTPPAAVPPVGAEIQVAWTPGSPVFRGYVLVQQRDRRARHESPWIALQCQDTTWRFDARFVTYRFPAQSVTTSIAYLLRYFCNKDPTTTSLLDFTTTYVQPNLASIPALDVVNERPTTVMRRLMATVDGGFYVDGVDLHAWAGAYEPSATTPTPLTNTLQTLKAFRLTTDATQLRRRVLVEGRRTSTLIGYPTIPTTQSIFLGVPVQDASLFAPATGPEATYDARIGTQWVFATNPISVAAQGVNPPQTRLAAPFAVGSSSLTLEPMAVTPPASGWIKVGGQFTNYSTIAGNPATGTWTVTLPASVFSYGVLSVAMPAGETVTWVDAILKLQPNWSRNQGEFDGLRTQAVDTPVVTLGIAEDTNTLSWPIIEDLVQDGRYSYAGATARAQMDLAAFKEPLVSAEWDTDDLNAIPGRPQVIALTGVDPVSLTLTILSATMTFPLQTLRPRRRCTAGTVKPSTLLDVLVTSSE